MAPGMDASLQGGHLQPVATARALRCLVLVTVSTLQGDLSPTIGQSTAFLVSPDDQLHEPGVHPRVAPGEAPRLRDEAE